MKRIINNTAFLLLVFLSLQAGAQSIINTKHNLSAGGPGAVKSLGETEVCIFCHTPHKATSAGAPLWNKNASTATYTLYSSSTMSAVPGQPDGASILCLSCHDGTIALGNLANTGTTVSFGGVTTMPVGATNLTTNLSDDHPISFVYNSTLAASNGQIQTPANITPPVSLDINGKLQCTSCHDAHDNTYTNFLVATNQSSVLCFSCHNPNYWNNSTHFTSNKTWNGSGTNPWAHTPYVTVAQNACENCHNPHTAGGPKRLLNYLAEEDNCLNCHNGNVASKNIQAQLTKTYKHNVYGYEGIHDAAEPALVTAAHVECVDCHNAHASNATTATAPNVNGFSAGVIGIDANGNTVNPVQYQYQICFRCHGDNPLAPLYTNRYRGVGNNRLNFATTNVSYHPVEAAGQNTSMTSLLPPLNVSSKIYCTDCHASDGAGSPAGPHGSSNIAILKYAYDTTRFPMMGTGWNSSDLNARWPLCFQCHNLSTVTTIHTNISGGHFLKYIGCNTCHDPHGYDGTLGVNGGSATSAFQELINFDTTVIRPNPINGKMIDIPNRKCYFVCHQYSTGTGGVYHVHNVNGSSF